MLISIGCVPPGAAAGKPPADQTHARLPGWPRFPCSEAMAESVLRVANPPTERPLVIYAGDCRYCRLWVDRWQAQWPGQLDFMPSPEAAVKFPEIPVARYEQAVQFVGADGIVHAGAAAGVRARAAGLGRRSQIGRAHV